MKAQLSAEFLLNFLLMMVLVAGLLSLLGSFLSASRTENEIILTKSRLESVSRLFDGESATRNMFISFNSNLTQSSDPNIESLYFISNIGNTNVYSYSIYSGVESDGEPI